MTKQAENPIDPSKVKKKAPTHEKKKYYIEMEGPSVSNLDTDLSTMKEMKYNPELERMAQKWIEAVLNIKFTSSFVESLRSGVLLCK